MTISKLYSDKFSEVLVEAILKTFSGHTVSYYFGDFSRIYVDDLCEMTRVLPDQDDENVEMWVKQLINTLNDTRKRKTFLVAMNKFIHWRDTVQGYNFWCVIYNGVLSGLDLCWFGEKDALQVALDGTWGESFDYIWKHSGTRNYLS